MRRFAIFILPLLFNSCVYTQQVGVDTSYQSMNEKLVDERVTIKLQNGAEYRGRLVSVNADWTSWLDDASGFTTTIATREIANIDKTKRGDGAMVGFFKGFGFGFVTGIAAGAIAGASDNAPESCNGEESLCYSTGDYIMTFGVGIGMVGGLIGAGVGARKGSLDRYLPNRRGIESPDDIEIIRPDSTLQGIGPALE